MLSILDILVTSYCMLMMSTIIIICNFILIISIINCFEKGDENTFLFYALYKLHHCKPKVLNNKYLEHFQQILNHFGVNFAFMVTDLMPTVRKR